MKISVWKRVGERPRKRRPLTRLLAVSTLIAFGVVALTASASASHFPVSTPMWGYEAGAAGQILQYDIGPADAFVSSCTPPGSLNGRGLAYDPFDGTLWYTFVDSSFNGDGLIHKTTPPPACAPVATIPFADGPGGTVQDDIGAIDVDPDDGNLWVAGYKPVGSESFLYKVDRTTGAVIDSCHVPFGDVGVGNDTLTEAKLSGLPGSGSYLLTDAGEITTSPNDLLAVDEATCTGGGAGTVVATFPKPVGMTGVDYETKLIASDLSSIYDLGTQPFASTLATMSAAPSSELEDITLKVTAGAPAKLTLAPSSATNTVGQQHCVTATVTDAIGIPVPGITVEFSVTGANPTSGTGTSPTDANGQATFCYTGTVAGSDTVSAYADTNSNTVQDPGEPGATATKTWLAGRPATLTLAPKTATNPVDSQHCVTATVTDQFGNPTPNITVQFSVSGSVTASGSAVTDANGQATFCYTGPALPGSDVITAFADTNGNATQDAGEPSDTAAKTWVQPTSTPGCKVTYGGSITAANGDNATFGGNASVPPKGQEEYQDHGPAAQLNVHSIDVQAVTCSADGTQASIFGKATINGSGTFDYRIDLTDLGEPGKNDTYRILLSSGYDSGVQVLKGGNVKIH
jgi:hypothetical protein